MVEKLTNVVDFDVKDDYEKCVNKITELLSKYTVNNKSIEREEIERVIDKCLGEVTNVDETVFTVLNAHDYPKYVYDANLQRFVIKDAKPSILPKATSKINLFNDRYRYVLQRTKRNFKRAEDLDGGAGFKLETIDCLLTRSNKNDDTTLYLGALFQANPGKFYLEDPTGCVELDLTHAK